MTFPTDFLDLLTDEKKALLYLATIMPDGSPQTTVVWCNFDGTHILINTMCGFRKEKNMRANPKVTLLCYDPRQPLRSGTRSASAAIAGHSPFTGHSARWPRDAYG